MKKLFQQIQSDATPLIIALVLATYSGLAYLFLNTQLNQNHLFGLIALLIAIYTYFNDKQIYTYFFGFTLIAGLIGYLDFSAFKFYFSIGKTPWLSFNPLFLILLVLHVFLIQKK